MVRSLPPVSIIIVTSANLARDPSQTLRLRGAWSWRGSDVGVQRSPGGEARGVADSNGQARLSTAVR